MIKPVFSKKLTHDEKILREEVFVIEQGFVDEFDEFDDSGWHLVLYFNDIAIACARFYPEDPETFHIGRVAVKKELRGKKIGTYLLKFVETKIKELGGRWATISSQLDKKGFYEKCGYHVMGEGEITYEQNCPHIGMAKLLIQKKGYKSRTQY